jgi:hypothetical protein
MDRAFTFGIVTDGSPEAVLRLERILGSIEAQGMRSYEVLIVGNVEGLARRHTRVLRFDESVKPGWITRKKNLITEQARFEHVVYCHDYLELEAGWYAGWRDFPDFDACMNPLVNVDGTRYRDWSLFYDPSSQAARDYAGMERLENLLPYGETSLSKLMYFSGAYWVARRSVMRELPLDERLTWGQGEDVIWSHQFRARHSFAINAASRVRLFGKKKDPIFREIPAEKLRKFKEWIAAHPPEPGYGCTDDLALWGEHEHFGPVKKSPALARGAA